VDTIDIENAEVMIGTHPYFFSLCFLFFVMGRYVFSLSITRAEYERERVRYLHRMAHQSFIPHAQRHKHVDIHGNNNTLMCVHMMMM